MISIIHKPHSHFMRLSLLIPLFIEKWRLERNNSFNATQKEYEKYLNLRTWRVRESFVVISAWPYDAFQDRTLILLPLRCTPELPSLHKSAEKWNSLSLEFLISDPDYVLLRPWQWFKCVIYLRIIQLWENNHNSPTFHFLHVFFTYSDS